MEFNTLVLDSEWHWIFDCPFFTELRMKFPVFSRILKRSTYRGRKFALAADLICLVKEVRIQSHIGFVLVRLSGRQLTCGSLGLAKCARGAAIALLLTIGRVTFSCIRPVTRNFLKRLQRSLMMGSLGSIFSTLFWDVLM
jgi:hypothetical protein